MPNQPKQKENPYPFAFKKLPEHIQNSKPKDYRYVDYEYASDKCKEFGIKSARQYRAWQFEFQPAAFPSNPDVVWGSQWISWDSFLQCELVAYAGTADTSVKEADLMPYEDAAEWTQSQNFKTVAEYKAAWDAGKMPKGLPRQPQARYPQFHKDGDNNKRGWKYFLGKQKKSRQHNGVPKSVCALCRIDGQPNNVLQLIVKDDMDSLRQEVTSNSKLQPVKSYYWLEDYADFVLGLINNMGTIQEDYVWSFFDISELYHELDGVLEIYREREK